VSGIELTTATEGRVTQDIPAEELRRYRNSKLYRSLARTLRVYNRLLVARLQELGFGDFQPSFPQILSNLDTQGTRIGVLAGRAGISRQAVGKLLGQIERAGYAVRTAASEDARATVVRFTPRGRRLLETILQLVEQIEAEFAAVVGAVRFEVVSGALAAIADVIDPQGAFGDSDEPDS